MPKKINNRWVFTDEELDEQMRRAEFAHDEYVKDKPVAVSYTFDPASRIISIRANDGSRIDFPVSKIRELQNASTTEIRNAYITKTGDAIHWDNLDAHYTVAGLAANVFGTREWMKELGRRGGSQKSAAKTTASRLNGMRGGRPTKKRSQIHKKWGTIIVGEHYSHVTETISSTAIVYVGTNLIPLTNASWAGKIKYQTDARPDFVYCDNS